MSSVIEIAEYDPQWPRQFQIIAASIREQLGELALRIDHIGSTSVPGLAAKDIIDVQITVDSLNDPGIQTALEEAGADDTGISDDHSPAGLTIDTDELQKRLFRFNPSSRPANIHVREVGRFNQEYPLLCRDYLRSHPAAAAAYAQIKRQLAHHFVDDVAAYYDVKDPTFDLFMSAAREWAEWTHWTQPAPDA